MSPHSTSRKVDILARNIHLSQHITRAGKIIIPYKKFLSFHNFTSVRHPSSFCTNINPCARPRNKEAADWSSPSTSQTPPPIHIKILVPSAASLPALSWTGRTRQIKSDQTIIIYYIYQAAKKACLFLLFVNINEMINKMSPIMSPE